ncbi:MAG: thermonuclease family protein [Anaerolineales bacterium]
MQKIVVFSLISISLLVTACGPSQAEQDAAVATQVAILIQQQASASEQAPAPTVAIDVPTADPAFPIPGEAACMPDDSPRVVATVVEVWSGDSIGVNINGSVFEVRYAGIDGDDNDQALEVNRQLVEGKQVLLVMDTTDVDQYGRLIRFVIADGIFVNLELLKRGVAFASAEEPDMACSVVFSNAAP